MASRSYYDVLQVTPRAKPEVIQAAFRALMKNAHPDHGGRDTISRTLGEAYSVLSDPVKRAAYDRKRDIELGTELGEYRLIEQIAEGGFGRTYKAEHILTGQFVCIKNCSEISPEDDEILLTEARAMWDLRHYAIPAVRNVLRFPDGSLALIMSYIPGPTLAQVVGKAGRLDPEHVAWITERLLNALKYIHYHGVVHGDVKPQNVIIQPESHHAVLVDFGLSMIKPRRDSENRGYTLHFAPPEQVGGSVLTPESDLYSLGMTMIYALCGGNLDHVKSKQVPRGVPEDLCDLIRRFIVRDPHSRPKWEDEDFCDTIAAIRRKAFGRRRSGLKPIPGFSGV